MACLLLIGYYHFQRSLHPITSREKSIEAIMVVHGTEQVTEVRAIMVDRETKEVTGVRAPMQQDHIIDLTTDTDSQNICTTSEVLRAPEKKHIIDLTTVKNTENTCTTSRW